MLNIRRLPNGLLEVEEVWMAWTEDRHRYWYYDTENWRKSSTGLKDSPVDRDMTPTDIEWVRRYYLPRVEK